MISYKCLKCGGEMSSPESLAGQEEKCPTCGHVCAVPKLKGRMPLMLGICSGGAAVVVLVVAAVWLWPRGNESAGQPSEQLSRAPLAADPKPKVEPKPKPSPKVQPKAKPATKPVTQPSPVVTPRDKGVQIVDQQANCTPGVTLQEGESYDFVFDRLDYQGTQSILPQVVLYLGKGVGQIRQDQHFTFQLFSNNFTEQPFATGTDPIVSRSMVSSAHGNAWQDMQGALRLTVTSGTITFNSLWIKVYTGTEVYQSTFRLTNAPRADDANR